MMGWKLMRIIRNTISVLYSATRFGLYKIVLGKRFSAGLIERISPNVQIFVGKGASLFLGNKIRIHGNSRLTIDMGGVLSIGENTALNRNNGIFCFKNIKIGRNCIFGPNVLIYDHDHDFRNPMGIKANQYTKEEVVIGDDVWLGANVVILKGTKLGNGCVVGAGAVISGTYKDGSVIIQKRNEIVKGIEMRNE